ncbi:21883_t:CDS:1 [Entrophospora sp. SA101]|nr:15935_t:CDS:1 [Entrophospora sp. SA101]CAJ0764720.1 21883_t:CDS:1 [Entrophospora sp. SA101]CAJ0829982.1 5654_t:CDS:1 [Entrophospora sp. SA101]CAJ0845728.1 14775_t:CDS:1 [Entrophospora sp. SA101]
MVKTRTKSRVRTYLNSNATKLSPEDIQKIRDVEAKKIPNRKRKICRDYKIGSDRYDDIVNGRIYPHPPGIEMAFNDSSISTPQLEISPKHSSSSVGNSEQVIHSSEPVSKKTSRKKVNSSVELSKGGNLSESKTVHHSILNNQSTLSVPENEVRARILQLRKYTKELQAES